MATSPQLSFKLREALGAQAGDELIGIGDRFAAVGTRFAQMGERIETQTSRLILWSFAFWATTLGTLLVALR